MKALRSVKWMVPIFALILAFAWPAKASEFDKLTIFTFNQPVEIPGGKVLPAGTYAFKVLDAVSDRDVVQIFNKDRTKLYATVLTIPGYNSKPSGRTIVKFSETPSGGPQAIKQWFYPGDTYGWEFVYPKSRAVTLAKASKQAVPSMPSNLSSDIAQPAKTADAASVKALENGQLMAQQPNGQEVGVGDAFGTKPSN